MRVVAILAVILLIIFWVSADRATTGVWRGSEELCKRADLEGFLVAIGPRSGLSRKVYVIMQANDMIIFNALLETRWFGLAFGGRGAYRMSIKNHDDVVNDIAISETFPQSMKVSIDFLNGKMTWSHDNTVYAELLRDNEATQHFGK